MLLAQAVCPLDGLGFHLRVPPGVQNEHLRSLLEVQAFTASLLLWWCRACTNAHAQKNIHNSSSGYGGDGT
jgi:hypothetical protein